MTQSKRIAVTGGIGSGKSLFCGILQEKGYPVFSCDEISKRLRQETEYLALVKNAFPDCVIEGIFSERALSKKIFSDESARKTLNDISHPLIMERLFAETEKYEVSFAEVPLLFEGGFESLFDAVIALVRDEEIRIASVMKRSGFTRDEVVARIESQFDYGRISEKECFVVENNGSKEELKKRAEEILSAIHL